MFDELRAKVGFDVPDDLLRLAMSHPSAVGEGVERTLRSNQRLEFLGDAVLSTVVAEHLYQSGEMLPEGVMTQRKAAAVCGSSLASAARRMGLPSSIILGKGEEGSGGRERDSIIADAFEALIGALFLSHGLEAARDFVLRALSQELESVARNPVNAKNLLQERTQAVGLGTPRYQSTQHGETARGRTFTAQVLVENVVRGRGSGRTKKEAEVAAATEALRTMAAD